MEGNSFINEAKEMINDMFAGNKVNLKYRRVLLKLSGESLAGPSKLGIAPEQLASYCDQIIEVAKLGVQVAIVIGGGNIFRGMSGAAKGVDRVRGDQMGMLATTINSIALSSALEAKGQRVALFSATPMPAFAEYYTKSLAVEALNEGKVVIISGGTGNPYFTTDTASALRGVELNVDAFFKGTRVDGIYDKDPEKDPTAVKYPEITFDEVYEKGLKVMDMTAATMCQENNLLMVVFNMDQPGNLLKVINGEPIGTVVKCDKQ